jgi:hypothetical protein
MIRMTQSENPINAEAGHRRDEHLRGSRRTRKRLAAFLERPAMHHATGKALANAIVAAQVSGSFGAGWRAR